jgi:lipoate-protein ligase A
MNSSQPGHLFDHLEVINDPIPQRAALNMAIDEALLETAVVPTIRFYRWDHPALSFGYFGKFQEVANFERDKVRRWTGGGIVLHGADLTYSIVIPAGDPAFAEPSASIYEDTHAAIRAALKGMGKQAELAKIAAPKVSESCFANAVRADVLLNGEKIAGAAQRRTRRGLLQQGSIQNVDLAANFEQTFATELSLKFREATIDGKLVERAEAIAREKYATEAWLRRR